MWDLALESLAQLPVGFDDVGNALARIETGNLADVVTCWVEQWVHLDVHAGISQAVMVVAQVPVAEILVQSVEPDGAG